MRGRAYVSGRGAVTAFGTGLPALMGGIFSGASALRPRRRLAEVPCIATVAGELPGAALPETELPFAMARMAAREALDEAGSPREFGLVIATTKADLSGILGPGSGLGSPHRLARRIFDDIGATGPSAAVSCACASGLSALALAGRWLRAERTERVLVVGTDALSAFVLRGFHCLLALDPGPCRPFDRGRRGLSLGEGAGALLLTAHARESIGIEVAGWGESNDANHITGPSRDGAGLRRAAELALRRAALPASELGFIHLHGTGTPFNDSMEAVAMGALFEGPTPPACGTKAQTGHTLGAAGVLESLIAIEALQRGIAPANVELVETDVDPRLSLTRAPAPLPRAHAALKVAAGFGGINAAMVFTA